MFYWEVTAFVLETEILSMFYICPVIWPKQTAMRSLGHFTARTSIQSKWHSQNSRHICEKLRQGLMESHWQSHKPLHTWGMLELLQSRKLCSQLNAKRSSATLYHNGFEKGALDYHAPTRNDLHHRERPNMPLGHLGIQWS